MKKEPQNLWKKCLQSIKNQVSTQSYQTWFAPIIPHQYQNNTLTILVPNQFFYEWLESHYLNLLHQVVQQQIGPKTRLAYQIINQAQHPPKNPKILQRHTSNAAPGDPLNPHFTFQNLVVGDFNQLAQAAAHAVASNPGKTSFNPFLIHGSTGLGKTHIAQAIAHATQENFSDHQVIYTTAEQFTNLFIQKIRQSQAQTFIQQYNQVDLLIIDDIQFFKRKEKTQEIFLQILNLFRQNNKQIIMTIDVPLSELEGFPKRLLSRFKWGLIVDLQQPNFETRVAIIESKLQQNQCTLSNEQIQYIAEHVTSNIREIEGVIISLSAHATLKNKNIDQRLIEQVISKIVEPQQQKEKFNIQHLQKIITNYFKISTEKLRSKSRKREIVIPRQLTMYLARKYTSNSLEAIAKFLGRKDHSTVSHALSIITQRIKIDKNLRNQLQEIEHTIQKTIPAHS